MDTIAYINDTETMRMSPAKRYRKTPATKQIAPEKTPESELMSVEEYFDILRKRVNDYYDGLQG